MIEPRFVQNVQNRARAARLYVSRAENDAGYPRLNDGPGAHRTRLDGDIQGAVLQSPVADEARGLVYGRYFRMAEGIFSAVSEIMPPAYYFSVVYDHTADGDLSAVDGGFGLVKRLFHIIFVNAVFLRRQFIFRFQKNLPFMAYARSALFHAKPHLH